jgi:hypothetical protein
MNQLDVYQAKDLLMQSIGLMAYEDRDTLVTLLRKNGVQVEDNVSTNDLLNMTYVAIANSLQFKKDLAKYLESKAIESYEGYVDEEFFNLTKEEREAKRTAKKTAKTETRKTQGGTKVGLAIKSVATPENIQSVINTGLGVLADSLTAKADRKAIQDATALASERSQQAIAEAQAQDSAKSKIKAWIIPTIIGVVVIGGIVTYLVIKKRNKA